MNDRTDIERVLDRWFDDGPTTMPERVAFVVADRIDRERQLRPWRLPWRHRTMNTPIKLGAAALAVVLVAIIGYNLLPGTSGVGGLEPTASPTTTPTTTTTTTPAASATPSIKAMMAGPLAAGTYRAQPFTDPAGLTVNFTMPDGWEGFPNWAVLGPNGSGAPGGIGIGFLKADGLFSDPCRWNAAESGSYPQAGDIAVGPTVDDLVAALRAHTAYTATEPTDITIDGHTGKQLVLQLPSDVDFSECDTVPGNTDGAYFPWGAQGENILYAQGPGNRWDLRILDVNGSRVVIVVDDYAETPAGDQAAARAIVDSVQFSP